MSQRITPLLLNKIIIFDWKLNKRKSSLENIKTLLDNILKEVTCIKKQRISAAEEKIKRGNLQRTLNGLGTNLYSIQCLNEVASSKRANIIDKKLKEKSTPELYREFLTLLQNIDHVRENSTNFQEAYREIEAEYLLKVSLYNMEILRREAK